jgi:antitoxin YefM
MNTTSYTSARKNLKLIMDKACENSEPIFIHRRNHKNVVILSEEEYLKTNETAYLLSSPANRQHLKKSLKELKNKEIVAMDIAEL